jgi:hypothetical protein
LLRIFDSVGIAMGRMSQNWQKWRFGALTRHASGVRVMDVVGRFGKARTLSVGRCIGAICSLLLGAATAGHASDQIFSNGFERLAIVEINEFNANISGGCDLIELRVITGGSMAGYLLQQRDTVLAPTH